MYTRVDIYMYVHTCTSTPIGMHMRAEDLLPWELPKALAAKALKALPPTQPRKAQERRPGAPPRRAEVAAASSAARGRRAGAPAKVSAEAVTKYQQRLAAQLRDSGSAGRGVAAGDRSRTLAIGAQVVLSRTVHKGGGASVAGKKDKGAAGGQPRSQMGAQKPKPALVDADDLDDAWDRLGL